MSSLSKKADSCCTREEYALTQVEQNKVICYRRQNLCHWVVVSVKFSLNQFPWFCGLSFTLCLFAYSIYVGWPVIYLVSTDLSFCLRLVLELLQFTVRFWLWGSSHSSSKFPRLLCFAVSLHSSCSNAVNYFMISMARFTCM